ncbi:MAG: heavy-metal-associated domain-containing protein [Thermoflexibacteraceae bacterium]|jgi:copper chaperone
MKTQQFKTNIKCASCIAKVTPYLDKLSPAVTWQVDTKVAEKVLTVTGEVATQTIIKAVTEAGFTIETKNV